MKDTLTDKDIRNAINILIQSSENERIERDKRRLKDWSKMSDFYNELEKSELSSSEKIELAYVIDMLAQGYYLVVGEYVYNLGKDYLQKLKVPQEVIDNIYKSTFLSCKSTN